jgi:protease-4
MKQFFITFFANLAALMIVFGAPVFLLMLLIIASFSVSAKGKRMISVERGSILVFDLSLNVTDSPEHATSVSPLDAALNNDDNKSTTLRHLTTAIEKAAKDERIKALFLTGSFQPADFGTGYSCLKELREAILDFKQSGKKVYAYLEAPSTRDYYVASAASYIYMNPFGEMETPGLASIKTYYADFFQKYGIDVQVTRVGKYKSAVEPFTVDKMSDADREETQQLLDDLWHNFVNAVAESRKIDPTTFQQLVDTEGYILPESALNAGLVDKLSYFGDVLKDLGKLAPSSDYAPVPLPFKQISIDDYINASRTPKLPGEESGTDNVVAILYLEGEIVDGWGDTTNIGGDRFAAQLRELQRDNDVKAVVLRVNSPGGSAYASEVIQNEIIKLKEKRKPVIVSMGNYAASGGYWVSTYGDRIFAEPNTITGSIGVFGLFMDVQKLANGFGITFDTAKTGNYADFETIARPKTPQEIALAQSRVDDLYSKFLKKVADGRHMPVEAVEFIAEGRVWSGSEALNIKLVDEIGGLDQAITYAAARAGIGSNYRVKEYPEQMSFAETLALLLSNNEQPLSHTKTDPLTQQFLKMKTDLKTLEDFNDPLGMYARLPLGWDIK